MAREIHPRPVLRGRDLRYALVVVLDDAGRPLDLSQIVRGVEAMGVDIPPPAHKYVADALRWEIDHRRVRRVARGTYTLDQLPRSTRYFIRSKVRAERNSPGRAA